MIFKTLESFQKKMDGAIQKSMKAQEAVDLAKMKQHDVNMGMLETADSIRAEADALIVRANQINKMLDKVTENYATMQ